MNLQSIQTRAYKRLREVYPNISEHLFQQTYYMSELSVEAVHDLMFDRAYADFLENFSISISSDRRRISHHLKLDQLKTGEDFIILPDPHYGVIHLFRSQITQACRSQALLSQADLLKVSLSPSNIVYRGGQIV